MQRDRLLEGLTEPQIEAVTHVDGPLLVLAGAGSGKTRVITRRAAHLALHVADPFRILAITFTNKAANEMRQRIEALDVGPGMTVCTFHSLCARLLRIHGGRVGLAPRFSIFDESDRVQAVKRAVKDLELDDTTWTPKKLSSRISRAKNDGLTPEMYLKGDAASLADQQFVEIYKKYEEILTEQDALDFDDLLLRTAMMLRSDDALRDQLEDRFQYVQVDEYQDTNLTQYEIARHLTRRRLNFCATGDPDQSIYGWRGANINNVLEFEEDFPDAKVVRLEQNYRSTKAILAAADSLIGHNKKRKKKSLWTENPTGSPVRLVECGDAEGEAKYLAEHIAQLREEGRPLSEIAIFYRINALTRLLEEGLRKAGIPYQIARGVEFYNRKEIKDAICYLRLMINPSDDTALVRIINTPARGIGKTTLDRLIGWTRDRRSTLWDAVMAVDQISTIGPGPAKRITVFADLMKTLQSLADRAAKEALETVLQYSGIWATLSQSTDDRDKAALDNVNELLSSAAEFDADNPDGTLTEWLHQISLVSDVDAVDAGTGAVTLMTLHAAKGLEFPVVFIVGLEHGLLPLERMGDSVTRSQLEEERRLCFVGITRAMEQVTLSHAKIRTVVGQTIRTTASPFLLELQLAMAEDLIERESVGGESRSFVSRFPPRPRRPASPMPANLDAVLKEWPRGQLVRHASFGLGRIQWIVPNSSATRIGVAFEDGGAQTLILEHAKLEKVEPVDDWPPPEPNDF
jgi:DNA helicase-2/ATP-dependent DNA helicase PcrA